MCQIQTLKLLAIVANMRGAGLACEFDKITYLGFPYAISPTFLKLNINKTNTEALKIIEDISNLCTAKNKQFIVYLSMAFGNLYGDEWNMNLVFSRNRYIKTIWYKDHNSGRYSWKRS